MGPSAPWAEEIAGWVEWAQLENYDVKIPAKLDTGANHSSIHAGDLKLFDKDGRRYARFSIAGKEGGNAVIEKPVIRTATIKRHFGKAQERSVIALQICIGSVSEQVEVNLVDRTGLNYQLLIGRSFLKGELLVDSNRMFLKPPKCQSSMKSTLH